MPAVNTSVKNIIKLERDSRHMNLAEDKIKRMGELLEGSAKLYSTPELTDLGKTIQAKVDEYFAIVSKAAYEVVVELESATKAVNLL